jgi:integrase
LLQHCLFRGFGPTKCKRSDRVIALEPQHLELLMSHLEKQRKVIAARETRREPYGEPKIKEWVLRERPQQSHLYISSRLIFPKQDGAVPNHTVPRGEFKSMLERAGIRSGGTNYRWYDLRHTHATFLLTLRLPDREIAERMGHSVLTLLKIYSHFIKSRRSVAAKLFVELIPVNAKQIKSPNEEDAIQKQTSEVVDSSIQSDAPGEAFSHEGLEE